MAFTKVEDWSETAASNTEINGMPLSDSTQIDALDNIEREHMSQIAKWLGDDTLASATTTDLGSVPGRYVSVTGTTTITGLGTIKAGTIKVVKFSGALTLTHNGTSLILPGAANITTVAGDTAEFVSEGSGNWRCVNYQRGASGPWSGVAGSWTPEMTFATPGNLSVAYSQQKGSYTRIAPDMVRVSFNIVTSTFTHTTASGTLQITGLPFASVDDALDLYTGPLVHGNVNSTRQLVCQVQSNSSFAIIVGSVASNAPINLDASHFPTATNFTLRGEIIYRV